MNDIENHQLIDFLHALNCTRGIFCDKSRCSMFNRVIRHTNNCTNNNCTDFLCLTKLDKKVSHILILSKHLQLCGNTNECSMTKYYPWALKLFEHIQMCNNDNCDFTLCVFTRLALQHESICTLSYCIVCTPVKNILEKYHEHEIQEEERKNYESKILLCRNIMEHSSYCTKRRCNMHGCKIMKKGLKHTEKCYKQNCEKCDYINILITSHTEECSKENCLVPDCNNIREN